MCINPYLFSSSRTQESLLTGISQHISMVSPGIDPRGEAGDMCIKPPLLLYRNPRELARRLCLSISQHIPTVSPGIDRRGGRGESGDMCISPLPVFLFKNPVVPTGCSRLEVPIQPLLCSVVLLFGLSSPMDPVPVS